MPTTDQLQTEIDLLTARVNAIDGQGLTDPTLAIVTVLTNKINGLQSDVKQTYLTIQGMITDLQSTVNGWIALLKTHLGIS